MRARWIVGTILSLAVSLYAVPAAAQETDAGFELRLAVAPTGLEPASRSRSPFKSTWSHLYAHRRPRDGRATDGDRSMTSQAGIGFIAPRMTGNDPQFWAGCSIFGHYLGMNHLDRRCGLGPVLAVKVRPGVRVYLRRKVEASRFRTGAPAHVHSRSARRATRTTATAARWLAYSVGGRRWVPVLRAYAE